MRDKSRAVDFGQAVAPFALTDATGSVAINTAGAEFNAPKVADHDLDPGRSLGGALGVIVGALSTLVGARRRIQVYAIYPGAELYVLGDVRKRADGSMEIAEGAHKLFISTRTEQQLVGALGWQAKALHIVGAILIGLGAWLALRTGTSID